MKFPEHYRPQDRILLRVDLDIKTKQKSVQILSERLAYMNDLNFLKSKNIKKIELIKKTRYGAKITLKREINFNLLIILQLMLGSDYRKEINTMINFYKLKMKYFNRLFTIKMYKDGKVKGAEIIDVTNEVLDYVNNPKRLMNKN